MKARETSVFTAATILAVVLCFSGNLSAYSGGTGETNNPYQIANVADFNQLSSTPTDCNKSFILTADINLAGVTLAPVGNSSTQFTGVFDGKDHKITNFTINGGSNSYVGLFGYIGTDGSVKNLGVENCSVSGGSNVGGLAGENDGSISSCFSTGTVSSSSNDYSVCAGGLVGTTGYNANIINCYSTGTVSGSSTVFSVCVGGLVGLNGYYANISNCYSMGTISGNGSVGGLVGEHYTGNISNCYSKVEIISGGNVGGLVAYNYQGSISNCYSTGNVLGVDSGGLVGGIYLGNIDHCYSTGAVSGTSYVGGLVAYNSNSSINGYWDVNTSGQTHGIGGGLSGGVFGKTTTQMKTLSTFAWWDFTNETANGTSDFWRMCVSGVDYPRLNWQSLDGDLACPDGVNLLDLDFFVERWLLNDCTSSNNYCGGADINYGGTVNFADFAIFADNWLKGI
jgi:hypothetical protein